MTTVYAETTFVLAYARRQGGSATEEIIRAAQEKKIELVVPVVALFEPLYHWRRRKADFEDRQGRMRGLANELVRADRQQKPLQHEAAAGLFEAAKKLARVVDEDRAAIATAIDTVESCAEVLQIPRGQFGRAAQNEGLVTGPADALVLTAVLDHALGRPGDGFFLAIDTGFTETAAAARLKEAGVRVVDTTAVLAQELRARGVL